MGAREDLEDAGLGLSSGLGLGFGDNLNAKLLEWLPNNDDTGIEREYAGGQGNQYLDAMRNQNYEAADRSPWLYTGGDVVGDLITTGLLSAATGGAGGLAGKVASKALPSVAGATAFAGHGDQDTASGMAKDAAIGTALGGVLGLAGKGLGKAGAAIKNRVRPAIDEIPPPLNIHTRPTVPAPAGTPTVPAPPPVPAAPTVPAPPMPAANQLRTVPAPAPQTLRPTVPAPVREAATVRPAANAELEEAIRAFAGRYNA